MAKNTHGRSTPGVELTDDVLERLARESLARLDISKDVTVDDAVHTRRAVDLHASQFESRNLILADARLVDVPAEVLLRAC